MTWNGTFKQPGWDHVQQAFLDGAREAQQNPTAGENDFKRAADGYTKRVFEEVDPEAEAAMREETWSPPAQSQTMRSVYEEASLDSLRQSVALARDTVREYRAMELMGFEVQEKLTIATRNADRAKGLYLGAIATQPRLLGWAGVWRDLRRWQAEAKLGINL